MCDFCEENLTNIPSGPPGPTGPTGPAGETPVLSGTSTSSVVVGTGSKSFTTQAGIAWVQGQRVRAVDSTNNNIIEGEITSYSSTTLTINADYIEGSGTISSWTISIVGSRGATGPTGGNGSSGPTGANAFGTTTGVATSLGANLYTLPILDNLWGVVGQIIFVETAGYYQITAINPNADFTVLDLLYSGNVPANMVSTSGLDVSPAGIRGATGAAGPTGSTGAAGPTGPVGPGFDMLNTTVANTAIPSPTAITMVASAAQTGKLIFTVTAYIKSDAEVELKATLRNNSVATSYLAIVTGALPISGSSYVQIAITGLINVTATNVIDVEFDLDDYTQNTEVKLISMNYYYR